MGGRAYLSLSSRVCSFWASSRSCRTRMYSSCWSWISAFTACSLAYSWEGQVQLRGCAVRPRGPGRPAWAQTAAGSGSTSSAQDEARVWSESRFCYPTMNRDRVFKGLPHPFNTVTCYLLSLSCRLHHGLLKLEGFQGTFWSNIFFHR